MVAREVARFLEERIDALPPIDRVVFVMRDVEEMGTAETAWCLGLTEEAVRARLHRARQKLLEALAESMATAAPRVFRFGGSGCSRVARIVLERLGFAPHP